MKHKDEKVVYQGQIVELVEYPIEHNGKVMMFEKARRSPGVRIIIETSDGGFILNREKRHELGLEEDLRLPGGKVFDSLVEYNDFLTSQKSEDELLGKAKQAAIKEAIEEVGIEPIDIEFFAVSKCGATMEWDLYYFVVKKYLEVEKNLKDTESMEIVGSVIVSKEELQEKALSGLINEDRSVAVILKYLNKVNSDRM